MCAHGTTIIVPIIRYANVDSCMADTVVRLNAIGIATTGSCCGHGHSAPSVTVLPSMAIRAQDMGFEVVYPHQTEGGDPVIVNPAKRLEEVVAGAFVGPLQSVLLTPW